MKSLKVVLVVALLSGLIVAEDKLPPRLVRVVGTAEIKVVPDRAVIEIGVEKQGISPRAAKQLTDTTSRKLLATIQESGIDEKDVQTTSFSLRPQIDYRKGRRPTGFVAEQTLSITIRDLAKLESLLESLIQAGGNRINSIDYETSDTRKYRDQARDLAVKAAREKAQALAKALGQDVGRAWSIEEVPESAFQSSALANYSNEIQLVPGKSAPTTAAGRNTISASVVVSFELN